MLESSPLSSAPSSQTQEPATLSHEIQQWKPARELPFELQQFVQTYFEESLFSKACNFLFATLTSDAERRPDVTVPPAEYLALIAVLIVHPSQTTRTLQEEKWTESGKALQYLRLLLRKAGPVNAKFKEAFRFRKLYDNSTNAQDEEMDIKHPYAKEDSLWSRAEDFWAVVGWAFNCSCLPDMYTTRWEHWHLWLDFMVDTLGLDWQYHQRRKLCEQSILWKYLSHAPNDNARTRRTVRAIFADGSKSSLNEFREVFKRELRGPKKESDKVGKREAVDIDKEIYGDYLKQDDSDDTSDNELRTSKRTSARRVTPRTSRQSLHSDFEDDSVQSMQDLGPPEAFSLRLRLMQLLVQVASKPISTQPRQTSFLDKTDLFTLFVEFIRPLPFAAFRQITSPVVVNRGLLGSDTFTTLLEFILQRLLETTSSNLAPLGLLTQSRLESMYLPYAANKASIDANARVSLCVEGLLRVMMTRKMLKRSDTLSRAVEIGIERRMAKIKDKKDKFKEGSDDQEAFAWLEEGSARMRHVIKRLWA